MSVTDQELGMAEAEEHSPAEKPGTGRAGGGLGRSAAQPPGRASGAAGGARGFLQPSPESPGDGRGTASQGRPGAARCSTVLTVEKSP